MVARAMVDVAIIEEAPVEGVSVTAAKTTDLSDGGPLLAAVTLGSNSFNLLLAKPAMPLPLVVAKHKRKVRLARGLAQSGTISDEASADGLDCLKWFGQLLKQYQPDHIAVYATAALRQASNADEFIKQANPLLGHSIEVISGEQEAKLIYHGMRCATQISGTALVLDIGGASTELVVGDEDHIFYERSIELGCVTTQQSALEIGLTHEAFDQIRQQVAAQLQPDMELLKPYLGCQAMGISGAVRSLFELAEARGQQVSAITPRLLELLEHELVNHGNGDLPGLCSERVPTFAAGVALLSGFMAALKIERLGLAGGALREGVLAELNERLDDAE